MISFQMIRESKIIDSLRGKRVIIECYDEKTFKFSFSKAENLQKAVDLLEEVRGNRNSFSKASRTSTNENSAVEGNVDDIPDNSFLSEEEWRKILPSKFILTNFCCFINLIE